MKETCAIILAAGKGTRMRSNKPKVLAQILFRPMLGYVTSLCQQANISDICVVTGYQSQMVTDYLTTQGEFTTVEQTEQKGTGHAVMMAENFLNHHRGKNVLVLCGDTPCLDLQTIQTAHQLHCKENRAVTLITAQLSDPTGYGRVIRQENEIVKIVEQKDASPKELAVCEINSASYWFSVDRLLEVLPKLTSNNAQQEYYLTDCIALIRENGGSIGGYLSPNSDILLGANTRQDLYQLNEKMRWKIIQQHMENGVEFVSTDGVYLSPDAKIGADTVILPGTILKEEVIIGKDCVIGPNTFIQKSTIGDRVKLNSVQCYQSVIHEDADIGPFVHIRPNSEIHHHVHIGDFVEVKNSTIGAGTGISHLTYVGDSDVGKNVNFGCGVVTVNYDGVHKNRCQIGDGAFIGCNTNLVAPVTLGENAYTAAGSTITRDVPAEALGIARAKQVIKPEFSTKKLAGRKKKV